MLDGPAARGISVFGEGAVEAEPDVAYAAVGIVARSASLQEAQREASRSIASVIGALGALGIDGADIQTAEVGLWRDEEGRGAFVADNHIRVRVREIGSVGAVLDAAVAAGANSVRGVSFSVEDRTALEDQARERAMGDAARKAAALARLGNVRLGSPVSIAESPSGRRGDAGLGAAMKMRRMAEDVPVEPGRIEVRVGVHVVYSAE